MTELTIRFARELLRQHRPHRDMHGQKYACRCGWEGSIRWDDHLAQVIASALDARERAECGPSTRPSEPLTGCTCTCPDECNCDGSFCDNAPCVERLHSCQSGASA